MVSSINGLNLFAQTNAMQTAVPTRVVSGQAPVQSTKVNRSNNPFGSSSEIFNGNSTGLNPNLQAGDVVFTSGQAGKVPGVSRIIANA